MPDIDGGQPVMVVVAAAEADDPGGGPREDPGPEGRSARDRSCRGGGLWSLSGCLPKPCHLVAQMGGREYRRGL